MGCQGSKADVQAANPKEEILSVEAEAPQEMTPEEAWPSPATPQKPVSPTEKDYPKEVEVQD